MSLFGKLFGGGGAKKAAAPVEHAGFSIHVDPMRDGSKWRIAARIEKEVGGEVKTHQMIRADTLETREAAEEATLAKAKMLIDQQGERIFS